jgi:hypothetical protein
MTNLIKRYATPFITGLFLVSLISGIALFFHVGQVWFHGMHEWLSMVLIAPFAFHLWKNWKAFSSYFRRAPMAIALVISLAAALYYAVPSGAEGGRAGGPPHFAFASAILKNPASQVAPLLGTTPEALVQKLTSAGFAAAASEATLSDIAVRSGKDEAALLQILVAKPQ